MLPQRLNSLLNSRLIDWEGNCEFDENGKVTGFRRETNTNSYSLRPIPKDSEIVEQAKAARLQIDDICRPCNKKEFAEIITRLSLHCALQKKDQGLIKALMQDYWEDIGHYPLPLVKEACVLYRRLPSGNEFMPTPGKLMDLVRPRLIQFERMVRKINLILGGESE